MASATERLGKHVPEAMDTHATKEELLETVFSTWSVKGGYITRTPASELSAHLKDR
jgi:alkylhydroperoxidase/carboxymuconolactone decarboxylase family protein YurZ